MSETRRKFLVLLNKSAGTLMALQPEEAAKQIRDRFDENDVDADVRLIDGGEIESSLKDIERTDFTAVIGGGGDGTLNTIANRLAGTDRAFGVLPLGTHNHFAKELNVPLDLDEAVVALARGTMTDLDIGEVNGRVFLNFSGLGLHPSVVKHRDAQRRALGRKKFFAMFIAFWRVLVRLPVMRVKLRFGDQELRRITPAVIVCNNAHQMEAFGVENVSYPDRSVLNVYLARSTSRLGVIWLILRAALRRLESAKKFEALVLPEFDMKVRGRVARVSIDGEIADLQPPLHYRVRKGGLKIIRPLAS